MHSSAANFFGQPLRHHHFVRPDDVAVSGKPKARHLCPRSHIEKKRALERFPSDEVEAREAVLRTVPRTAGEFVARIHTLARHLKAISASETACGWGPVFKVWFFLAQPVGGRKWPWDSAWKAFAVALSKPAKAPAARLDRAATGSAKAVRGTRQRICAALAAIGRRFGATFFASARLVAKWVGCSSASAGRHLKALAESGTVRVVTKGKPHPIDRDATTYDVSPLLVLSQRFAGVPPIPDAFTAPLLSCPASRGEEGEEGGCPFAEAEVLPSCVSPLGFPGVPPPDDDETWWLLDDIEGTK